MGKRTAKVVLPLTTKQQNKMKNFTTEEIRDLLDRVMREEISLSEMVEILNERVSETNEPQYKDGDFVVNMKGSVLIFRKKVGDFTYDHAYFSKSLWRVIFANIPSGSPIKRYATEEEKQRMFDALAKKGKRWNAEGVCVEDMPVRKFKKGDKVRIRHGVSSKTHYNVSPTFAEEMDDLIGKIMTVDRYTDGNNYLGCDGIKWVFLKDWLEPYEELKKGDLAIFWEENKKYATIRIYNRPIKSEEYVRHQDNIGSNWANAIKFESKEQYERLIRGEI